eukprot:11261729-Heterocapsa_arctica.AAC.1
MSKAGCKAFNCEQAPLVGAGSPTRDTTRAARLRQAPRALPIAKIGVVQGQLLALLCSTGSTAH